ncbi:sensor histidine kinase [Blastochloris tepida]|uniref:sensor histidine kinase n=1 Tax=Blastochloris tepida TaxID=2233851 RepID=UPI000F81FE6C|nr:sensor histidine kinase [Blastochloris tepida]
MTIGAAGRIGTHGAAVDGGRTRARRDVPLAWLLAFLILASVAPLVLIGAYTIMRWADVEHTAEIGRVSEVAHTLAQAVDRDLRSHSETAEVLAASRALVKANFQAFDEQARAVSARGGHVVLVDRSLRPLVDTRDEPARPAEIRARPVEQVFASGRMKVGNAGPMAGEPDRFAIYVPVSVEREVRSVLMLMPPPAAIQAVLQQTYRPEGWFAAILDGEGRVVARSAPERGEDGALIAQAAPPELLAQLAAPEGVFNVTALDGQPAVAAYRRSSLNDWRAVVWVPKAVLEAPSNQRRDAVLALLGLTTLVSIGAALFGAHLINRSTRRTVNAARALGEGAPISLKPTLIREDNLVCRALADAAETIAAREDALHDSARHMGLVMRELSHRSKNLLTVVQSMARQTGRHTSDAAEFQARFEDRISSLARSHDLLVARNWTGATVAELVERQLLPFLDAANDRISLDGPALLMKPDAAQNIGMALHELATNASKHGALSVPSGRIRIVWRVEDAEPEPRLHMSWEETGGPPVEPPARRGFGHVVIERMVSMALRGQARLDWKSDGVAWTLDVPLAAVCEHMGRPIAAAAE